MILAMLCFHDWTVSSATGEQGHQMNKRLSQCCWFGVSHARMLVGLPGTGPRIDSVRFALSTWVSGVTYSGTLYLEDELCSIFGTK